MNIWLIALVLCIPLIGITIGNAVCYPEKFKFIKRTKKMFVNSVDNRQIKGNLGENAVAKQLELLNNNYKVIHNGLFQLKNDIMVQVDHIVISRYGVFVVETKNYGGVVEENERGWWKQIWYKSNFDFYNPMHQNESHIKSLMYVLFTKRREIFKSVLVFPNTTILHTQKNTPAIHVEDLCRYIEKFDTRILTDKEVDDIYNKLCSRNIYSKKNMKKHRQRVDSLY